MVGPYRAGAGPRGARLLSECESEVVRAVPVVAPVRRSRLEPIDRHAPVG